MKKNVIVWLGSVINRQWEELNNTQRRQMKINKPPDISSSQDRNKWEKTHLVRSPQNEEYVSAVSGEADPPSQLHNRRTSVSGCSPLHHWAQKEQALYCMSGQELFCHWDEPQSLWGPKEEFVLEFKIMCRICSFSQSFSFREAGKSKCFLCLRFCSPSAHRYVCVQASRWAGP